jgi:hypothetical protein
MPQLTTERVRQIETSLVTEDALVDRVRLPAVLIGVAKPVPDFSLGIVAVHAL